MIVSAEISISPIAGVNVADSLLAGWPLSHRKASQRCCCSHTAAYGSRLWTIGAIDYHCGRSCRRFVHCCHQYGAGICSDHIKAQLADAMPGRAGLPARHDLCLYRRLRLFIFYVHSGGAGWPVAGIHKTHAMGVLMVPLIARYIR